MEIVRGEEEGGPRSLDTSFASTVATQLGSEYFREYFETSNVCWSHYFQTTSINKLPGRLFMIVATRRGEQSGNVLFCFHATFINHALFRTFLREQHFRFETKQIVLRI